MSASRLVSAEIAITLSFPQLAKNIRENLEEAKVTPTYPLNGELLRKLTNILEGKAADNRPPQPQLAPPPLPPYKPRIPDLAIPATREYESSRLSYLNAISVLQAAPAPPSKKARREAARRLNSLRNKMDEALTEIALKNQPGDFQKKWREAVDGRANFKRKFREYQNALRVYARRVEPQRRARAAWVARYGKRGTERQMRSRIIDHLRSDIRAYLEGDHLARIQKVWWRFLPPGPSGVVQLASELNILRRRYPALRFDEERLLYAHSLRPTQIFVGQDEFEGYFAFIFDRTDHVLLENPQEGNAAYIFKRDWTSLSRLPKFELLNRYPQWVQRVLHRDIRNWKLKIRHALGLR